jgi:peptidoglycan/xylan/chitin deacetylase (PgdA/CDA1 family)/SAM-dependent methyltransferase
VTDRDLERLLVDKERLILAQRERHERLSRQKGQLEAELRALHAAIDETVTQLHALGRGRVEFGDLRRTAPISPVWGLDRGIPLDRYYIHRFLDRHQSDIRGRVLEVKDSGYARAFGADRVTACDVLDVDPANTHATVVADLSRADTIADETYDCFILTQTLGVIYDVAASLRHAVRVLKPGGVLLCTLPAAGRISYDEGLDGDYWRFTEASVRRLFEEVLPPGSFEVRGHGNVLACTAFLYGLAPHELTADELDTVDPYFPVVYTVRAVKPRTAIRAAVLTYHRVASERHDPHGLCIPPDEFRAQMQDLHDSGCRVVPLHDLVAAATRGELDERSVSLTFDDGYQDAVTNVAPVLQEFGFPATFFIVGAALEPGHEFWWDEGRRTAMDADEVRRLSRMPGMSIGAHSQQHLSLPTLSNADKRADIETCKARLEAVVGQPVQAFSYPYGHVDPDTVRCVRESGFAIAVTTEARAVSGGVDPLLVPRFEMRRSGAAPFASLLAALTSV